MAINATDIVKGVLGNNLSYPEAQVISPINAMLGHTIKMTPQINSGLPVQPVNITNALVAEVIKPEPVVKENFTYSFGMGAAMVPMPRVGRNVYDLGFTIYNGVPTYSNTYAFMELMSVANSLILCKTEAVSGSGNTGGVQKLTMVNSTVYNRPSFLGYLAGATEITEAHERASILGSIDFTKTVIDDKFDSIVGTLGLAVGAIDALGNLIGG